MGKLKDAVYGLAVADAVGVPFEFKKRGTFNATDMIGYGTYGLPQGTWSDDTSMTIATCDSIRRNNKSINLQDIMNNFVAWRNGERYVTCEGLFDIGNTTSLAISNYERNKDVYNCGLKNERSNGNGSLMRIIPLAFIECDDEDINNVSQLTHAHEISKEGCRIYIKIARELLKGEELRQILMPTSETYSRLSDVGNLSETEIKSSGFVVDSLEAALWSLLNTNNYKDCVLKAVNLGEDTDTVAAIAGALAGIIYGYEAIPKGWIEKLRNKEIIDECLF